MKKIIIVVWAAVLVVSFLSACQSTPEKPVVIQKDMEQMLEKAQATDAAETPGLSLREQTGAPETLTLEKTEGNFILSVDAKVAVPDAQSMPIIRVKAGEFSQKTVSALWDELVGDTVLWRRETGVLTKKELGPMIIDMRRNIAEYDNIPYHTGTKEQMEEELKRVEAQYDSAPEEAGITRADPTLRETIYKNESTTYKSAGGYSESDMMNFSARNTIKDGAGYTMFNARMEFFSREACRNFGQAGTIEVDGDTELDESVKQYIKTTPLEARTAVEDFCERMGMQMAVYSMELVNDEETGVYDGVVAPVANYAYRIDCVRVVQGDLPVAFIYGGTYLNKDGMEPYTRQWEYEKLEFLVNDSGIIRMEWTAPLETGEVKVQGCTLLPFSDIQSTLEKMMRITYEAQAKGVKSLTCHISGIRLEMMRIVEQDSLESGLLVPAWNFYGKDVLQYGEEKGRESACQSLLCINAIDGSVIDPHAGY